MKKKILVFGGSGLLGSNFIFFLKKKYNFIVNFKKNKIFFEDLKYVKIIDDFNKINITELKKKIDSINPDIIFNSLAIANIEKCEKNKNNSYLVNYLFVDILSKICEQSKIKLIHISTDQLFSQNIPFKNEKFQTSPLNVYGKHKLMSEDICLINNPNCLIIRTNFFGYSPVHKKITDMILLNNSKLKLYSSYFFTPIYTRYLTEIIHKLIVQNAKGIFNVVGNDRISKYRFGQLLVRYFNLNDKIIEKNNIKKKTFFSLRNSDLSLSNKKICNKLNITIPNIKKQIQTFNKDYPELIKALDNKFPYGKHSINSFDIKSVIYTLQSGSLTQGDKILETEKFIAKYVGAKFAVAVSSATAGLHISYLAAGVGIKKNIITSPLSFVATSNAAYYCGSKVYFSDIDKFSLNLCAQNLHDSIKKNKNIHVIAPVHFGGVPADMIRINEIAKKFKLKVIEDAAHALGSKFSCGAKVGSCKYSDMTVFSFHPVKIVAGGEGGVITTNSEKLYNKLLELRSHGISKIDNFIVNKKNAYTNNLKNPWYYEMNQLGYHYRQTDIHCSLILSQMKRIDEFLNKRKKIALKYDLFLKKNNISFFQGAFRKNSSNHLYIISVDFDKIKINRAEFMLRLRDFGIITQVHYIPIPMHPYYIKKKYTMKNLPNTMSYYKKCLSIPIYYDLTSAQQEFVQESIVGLLKENV